VDLEQRMRDGAFREDLFYRLNVVTIDLPSLSERESDLVELLQAFVANLRRKLRFSREAVEWLSQRRWPGNVRELRNLVQRLDLLAESDDIDVATLRDLANAEAGQHERELEQIVRAILALPTSAGSKLQVVERAVLQHAVAVCDGNKSAAARLLGVDRRAVDRRWQRMGDSTMDIAGEGDEP
jgi:DNA-binding NtrC family response regulator